MAAVGVWCFKRTADTSAFQLKHYGTFGRPRVEMPALTPRMCSGILSLIPQSGLPRAVE